MPVAVTNADLFKCISGYIGRFLGIYFKESKGYGSRIFKKYISKLHVPYNTVCGVEYKFDWAKNIETSRNVGHRHMVFYIEILISLS